MLISIFITTGASAVQLGLLTPEKRSIIETKCVDAQVTLQRIKYSDAANRVNRGQAYEDIMTNLMLPMNSRAAANGFNRQTAGLSAITTSFQDGLERFKEDYEAYDDTLNQTLDIDCKAFPDEFHTHLLETRILRVELSNDIKELSTLIKRYDQIVESIKQQS